MSGIDCMPKSDSLGGWPVVGHGWALERLERAVSRRQLSHAYLFAGPQQVGKRTVAKAFAQALLCETGSGTPCGACSTCKRISQGRYPDVQEISAEKNTIQIDQIRALQADVALSPLEGAYKVFIIREIERATLPAANALLKTLEEPPPSVVLLLTSTRRDRVLPTILSRCQVIGLRPVPQELIESMLVETRSVDPERAVLLARLSSGSPGWAIDALGDSGMWQKRSRRIEELLALTGQDAFDRLQYAEVLSHQSGDVEQALGFWSTWWHDVLLIQQGLHTAIVNLDRRAQLNQMAGALRQDQVMSALSDVAITLRRIRANVNARLALEVLALRLPRAAVA